MPVKIIVNEHIQLTEIRPGDKADLVKCLNDREIYERTLRIPYPYSEAHAEEWFAHDAEITKQHGQPVNWAIRADDGRLIGGLGFRDFEIGKSHKAELGYWLARPLWGQGIMTAVVGAACAFAIQQWGLVRITAEVFASNAASARVLEKNGFLQEGYLRKQHCKDGAYIDARLFALVK
jgi:[ribosomal protein S5]-alanine N-acetyltransferase